KRAIVLAIDELAMNIFEQMVPCRATKQIRNPEFQDSVSDLESQFNSVLRDPEHGCYNLPGFIELELLRDELLVSYSAGRNWQNLDGSDEFDRLEQLLESRVNGTQRDLKALELEIRGRLEAEYSPIFEALEGDEDGMLEIREAMETRISAELEATDEARKHGGRGTDLILNPFDRQASISTSLKFGVNASEVLLLAKRLRSAA
ncbi:MAG: hypothetical protein KDD53_04615, partial [Bdellovibrionales bacterium]|nr:hypothetical protein [Bdellovibrionales bacterium]